MEPLKESISVRISRLNDQLITKNIHFDGANLVNCDTLLDALNVLYEECNNEHLKKNNQHVSQFINKFRTTISELKLIRPSIFDFEVGKVIGSGSFGEINFVREKQTGNVYAMKTMRKSEILKYPSVFFYQEERDIMATTTSPWLTKLQYSFQDTSHLYFVMELHSSYDLFALLDRYNRTFSESYCKFYLAELTLAINALHNMGYVHQDLKPENILLDRRGHLKLVDFGLSAKLSKDGKVTPLLDRYNRTFSESYCKFYLAELTLAINALHNMGYVHQDLKPENILLDRRGHLKLVDFGLSAKLSKDGKVTRKLPNFGPSEYVAPEIVKSRESVESYGIESDYWSLGIIAYYICIGNEPYRGCSLKFKNSMNDSSALTFPEDRNISEPYKNFICALLTDADCRLTYDGCLKHEFFKNINWNGIRDEVSPFVQKINSVDDALDFIELEHKFHNDSSVENFKRETREISGYNLPFIGFTYTPDAPELETSVRVKFKEAEKIAKSNVQIEEETNRDLINQLENCQIELASAKDELHKLRNLQS